MKPDPILVTAATGYVGGRQIPAVLAADYWVRAMVRSLDKLVCRPWSGHIQAELVKGDVLDLESLKQAACGCRAAYYLVHSMILIYYRYQIYELLSTSTIFVWYALP